MALAAANAVARGRAGAGDLDTTVLQAAIGAAVQARMGEGLEVRVEPIQLAITGAVDRPLIAVPEPGARLGRPIRFSLLLTTAGTEPARRIGYVVARVHVVAEHGRIAKATPRGTTLAASDVEVVVADVGPLPIRRLPSVDEMAGARTLRDLQAGEVITHSAIGAKPLVASGDAVATRARRGPIEVEAQAIAMQRGMAGDTIRVMNPSSRKVLKARVVGPGIVEVVQ